MACAVKSARTFPCKDTGGGEWLAMSFDSQSGAAAVAGLIRSDPHSPGITRRRDGDRFLYVDPSGAAITSSETLARIKALAIPPAWTRVWISPDPLGHIQATGVDSRGRTQYRYHDVWREQRDAQKFAHMLRFAGTLPALREATLRDLRHHSLDRERVVSGAVRLIDLGLFRIGGERYAELDHHYGIATLEKRHITVGRNAVTFDYLAKEGKRREITVTDRAVMPTIRALAQSTSGLDALFTWEHDGRWHALRSHDVSEYIATRAGAHFTAKEFRTWNATVLMALLLASAEPAASPRRRNQIVVASVRGVAEWLGDTSAVARASYIDPRLISRYQTDGQLPEIPALPAQLPVGNDAEFAVAALLAAEPSSPEASSGLLAEEAEVQVGDPEKDGLV
jgi:DNA topoisomerase I